MIEVSPRRGWIGIEHLCSLRKVSHVWGWVTNDEDLNESKPGDAGFNDLNSLTPKQTVAAKKNHGKLVGFHCRSRHVLKISNVCSDVDVVAL